MQSTDVDESWENRDMAAIEPMDQPAAMPAVAGGQMTDCAPAVACLAQTCAPMMAA